MNIDLNKIKKVYLCGIGGIGVSALARYFLNLEKEVCGSDAAPSEITRDLESKGIVINQSQDASNISSDIDLFIFSSAVPESNPERQRASELGIAEISYNDFLGWLSGQYDTVAVCGTNGKTTTTGMTAGILIDARLDPTVVIGSNLPRIKGNFRLGQSPWLVLEACEYREHFLKLSPKAVVITNIEEDHLDYFRDLNHIIAAFQKFIDKLEKENDILVINKDDEHSKKLIMPKCQVVTYGFLEDADVQASNYRIEEGRQRFSVSYLGNDLGEFELMVAGKFNVSNALAAIALALKLNISLADIKKSLANFSGAWRRLEVIGKNPLVISDYAHHPTAVEVTRNAVDDFYPGKRKIIVFQPHQHNRTKKLFDEFVQSLLPRNQDELIIVSEIYDVRGRKSKEDENISSENLVQAINGKKNPDLGEVIYSPNLESTLGLIRKKVNPDDLVLVMGAGDVYELVDKI
ncbi:MAG: UDP-N-acetylmuramate--L-alanine ligase [Patescibacteria group bacterium]